MKRRINRLLPTTLLVALATLSAAAQSPHWPAPWSSDSLLSQRLIGLSLSEALRVIDSIAMQPVRCQATHSNDYDWSDTNCLFLPLHRRCVTLSWSPPSEDQPQQNTDAPTGITPYLPANKREVK